ncbi:TPA: hypothetical protein HA253_02855 [Candidatus Woesearchaeota archaeon]|nr:hypothetical protein [Candidatus Woesearchaeota archaeon]
MWGSADGGVDLAADAVDAERTSPCFASGSFFVSFFAGVFVLFFVMNPNPYVC